MAKQRDYSFDIFRGLCMWAIPISHFTRMGGGQFSQGFLGRRGLHHDQCFRHAGLYVPLGLLFQECGIKVVRARFKTALWPYLLSIPFFLRGQIRDLRPCDLLSGYASVCHVVSAGSVRVQILSARAGPPSACAFALHGRLSDRRLSAFPDGISGAGEDSFVSAVFYDRIFLHAEHIRKLKCLKRYQSLLLFCLLISVSFVLAYLVPQVSQGMVSSAQSGLVS